MNTYIKNVQKIPDYILIFITMRSIFKVKLRINSGENTWHFNNFGLKNLHCKFIKLTRENSTESYKNLSEPERLKGEFKKYVQP